MNVLTDTLTPSGGSVWLASGTTLVKPGTLARVTFGVDHRVAQDLYEILADEPVVCYVEGWQVLATVRETCTDCGGTGSIPAGGGEEHQDNGQAPCASCTAPCAYCVAGEGSAHTYQAEED